MPKPKDDPQPAKKKTTTKKEAAPSGAAKPVSKKKTTAAATKKTAKKKTAKKKPAAKKPAAKKATAAAESEGAEKASKKKAAKKKVSKKKKTAAVAVTADDGADDGGAKKKGGKKALVVVESPAKAKTINKFLGKGYLVTASMGHIRDLPKNTLGVSIKDDFEPTYEPLSEKRKVIADLRKHAKQAETVYLACDMDREGEAIAWHISELLQGQAKDMQRVTFNQITKEAIQKAFQHPRALDMAKVNAQQARRILDRIVGYKLSQLLWKKVRRGLSAGRVQSVATKLVVEREEEIDRFVPVEYWELDGVFDSPRLRGDRPAPPPPAEGEEPELPEWRFAASMAQLRGQKLDPAGFRVADEAQARALEAQLRAAPYRIASIVEKETKRNPKPPFITSTLQQAASTQLSFGAKRTMSTAQSLYEGVEVGGEGPTGLITYMRTDSFMLAPEAVAEAREFIGREYGADYLPESPRRYRRGNLKVQAQEAHEAIRPTSVERTPAAVQPYLTPDQYKLYKLVWERFVACQTNPARFKNLTVEVAARLSEAEGDEALFRASGQTLLFDGYLRVSGKEASDRLLPPLVEGEALTLVQEQLAVQQKFTKPPARYNEASLVKKLEEEGIGRPSTYATIISTIQDRGYVEQRNRALHATTKGRIVTRKLEEFFGDIMAYDYTRDLERDLDRIEGAMTTEEEGDDAETKAAAQTLEAMDWKALLHEFYDVFSADLEKAEKEMAHVNDQREETDYPCPTCGEKMVKLYNTREFTLFLGCPKYPECKTTVPLDEAGKPMPEEESEELCPKCGKNLVVKSGRRGRFFACTGYPECTTTFEIGEDGKPVARPEVEADCPECGQAMTVRYGRLGAFLGCPGYPKCRGTLPLVKKADGSWVVGQRAQEDMPKVDIKCERCGSAMAIKRSARGPFLGCTAYPKCRATAKLPADIELPPPPEPEPYGEDCELCGKPLVVRQGRRGPFVACSGYPACKNTKNVPA